MPEIKKFKDYKNVLKENLKELKVIYSDLDGTLLNDKGCLIKDIEGNFFFDVVKLFKRISDKGWDVVLASGRNKLQLKYNAMLLGVRNYIPELGCEMVYDFGEKVYPTFDAENFSCKITRGGKDLLEIIKLLKHSFPGKVESLIEWSMERTYNALFFGDIDLEKANAVLEENGFSQVMLVDNGFSNLVKLDLDVKRLRILNLIPKGVSKASAIKLDKKIRKLADKNCIALGDSAEDLKMAGDVFAFFITRDAIENNTGIVETIKKYDNVYVTENRMNRGWAEVVKYLAY